MALVLLAIIVVTVLSAFSSITLAATRHQVETSVDRLARSDAEYIKSQGYRVNNTPAYSNLSVAGYAFVFQILYWDPTTQTFSTANSDNGLQEFVLTVSGPSGVSERLDFLKVQP